jgi:uncharacterized protein YjbJ (UPF0337 family)
MNDDILAGHWKEMRGALKSWWGNLTDDDFERIGGQKDKLIGVIQEKYGHTREQAHSEVERRLNEYGDQISNIGSSGVGGATEKAKGKALEFGAAAASKAREATAGVASGLETAGSYLRENKVENIAADVAGLIRKHPVRSVLIGAGIVYFLSRSRNR